MVDHVEVLSKMPGFGSRMGSSIKGVFVGVILFLLSFPLIWWGETRQNLAEFVKEATQIESQLPVAIEAQALVKTTGIITSSESVMDPVILNSTSGAKPLSLSRSVEMYAWKEKKKTKKKGDKKVTTYDYVKTWTSSPSSSSNFYETKGHANPSMTLKSQSFQVKTAKVGQIPFEANQTTFYKLQDLAVTQESVNVNYIKPLQVSSGVVYVPVETATMRQVGLKPKVGDLKISYQFFPTGVRGTVVGSWTGQTIDAHVYDDSDHFLGAFGGSAKLFEAYLESRHSTMTWVLRVVSFFMMWMGLNMILGPLITLMGSIPFLGQAGKAVISMVTFGITFLLWGITMFLANFWLVLLIVIGMVIGATIYIKKNKEPAAV